MKHYSIKVTHRPSPDCGRETDDANFPPVSTWMTCSLWRQSISLSLSVDKLWPWGLLTCSLIPPSPLWTPLKDVFCHLCCASWMTAGSAIETTIFLKYVDVCCLPPHSTTAYWHWRDDASLELTRKKTKEMMLTFSSKQMELTEGSVCTIRGRLWRGWRSMSTGAQPSTVL